MIQRIGEKEAQEYNHFINEPIKATVLSISTVSIGGKSTEANLCVINNDSEVGIPRSSCYPHSVVTAESGGLSELVYCKNNVNEKRRQAK